MTDGGAFRYGGGGGAFESVVVGVGGSDRSHVALQYAMDLAEAGQQPLRVAIVRAMPTDAVLGLASVPGYRDWLVSAKDLARRAALEVEKSVESLADGRDVTLCVEHCEGPVTDCLVEAADTASCLVMGKRGHRGDHGGLLSVNAEAVVRRVHVPVLLTPREYASPTRVLAAYAAKSGGTVLAAAVTLSRLLQVPLHLLTVDNDRQRLTRIQEQGLRELEHLGGSATLERDSGRVVDAIIAHATGRCVLVMGAYGHSRVYRMALGSVTEETVRRCSGPVLLAAKPKPAKHDPAGEGRH